MFASESVADADLLASGVAVEEASVLPVLDAVPEGVAAVSADFEPELAAAGLDEDVTDKLDDA